MDCKEKFAAYAGTFEWQRANQVQRCASDKYAECCVREARVLCEYSALQSCYR